MRRMGSIMGRPGLSSRALPWGPPARCQRGKRSQSHWIGSRGRFPWLQPGSRAIPGDALVTPAEGDQMVALGLGCGVIVRAGARVRIVLAVHRRFTGRVPHRPVGPPAGADQIRELVRIRRVHVVAARGMRIVQAPDEDAGRGRGPAHALGTRHPSRTRRSRSAMDGVYRCSPVCGLYRRLTAPPGSGAFGYSGTESSV